MVNFKSKIRKLKEIQKPLWATILMSPPLIQIPKRKTLLSFGDTAATPSSMLPPDWPSQKQPFPTTCPTKKSPENYTKNSKDYTGLKKAWLSLAIKPTMSEISILSWSNTSRLNPLLPSIPATHSQIWITLKMDIASAQPALKWSRTEYSKMETDSGSKNDAH